MNYFLLPFEVIPSLKIPNNKHIRIRRLCNPPKKFKDLCYKRINSPIKKEDMLQAIDTTRAFA